MTTTEVVARLTALIEPEASVHGFELVAVEILGGHGTQVVRVLLESSEGTDLDAIGSASRWVSDLLDEADPIGVPYVLEVSSPGVDRPLIKRADFVRFAGQSVNIKVLRGDKRASVKGVLIGMEGDEVIVEIDGDRVCVPFETIQKARLKGVVDFGQGRGQL
ncbi:MAG: ribosome maturation factor RimP [Coriobacteriia bacterium]